jgi:hypothetical protein
VRGFALTSGWWALAEPKNVGIVVALIGAAGVIIAALIANSGGSDGPTIDRPTIDGSGSASVFLSRDSGPGGTIVQVSGEGFASGERIVIQFHTEQIGSTTANGDGKFANVAVTIPESFSEFAPQQFFVIARGEGSHRFAQAPFTISG